MQFAYKYGAEGEFERGLLANANVGGENVHRGIVLGCMLGASVGANGIPDRMKQGLKDHDHIKEQIEAFVNAVAPAGGL